MKQDETKMTVGVDVSKHRLDVFELGSGEAYSIPNTLESIEQWLDRSLLEQSQATCQRLLRANRGQLDALAGRLLEREVISGEELKGLLGACVPLPVHPRPLLAFTGTGPI